MKTYLLIQLATAGAAYLNLIPAALFAVVLVVSSGVVAGQARRISCERHHD